MQGHGETKHPLDILDQQFSENYYRESILNEIQSENFSLWQYIKNLQISNPDPITFLLLFDQFEELFTLCRDKEIRRSFVDNLLDLIQTPDARYMIILTMRTDFETYDARLPKLQALF